MRAALAGDAVAYRVLLGELAMAIRAIVRSAMARAGRGNADIEDIVQEALLAVHLKRDNWNQALAFAPWVNAIVRYKIIDALRRQGYRMHLSIDEFAEVIAAPASDDQAVGDAERLIRRLGPRQQRIVRGVSLEGKSTSAVARGLNMSEGAVRVALHRALKELARLYRGEDK